MSRRKQARPIRVFESEDGLEPVEITNGKCGDVMCVANINKVVICRLHREDAIGCAPRLQRLSGRSRFPSAVLSLQT
ncbi:hypothetical protein J6590_076435 [Homalodisca vitripennis]|nr:hypothetical protein J6590_076435 [Homalodisca vitripennis]